MKHEVRLPQGVIRYRDEGSGEPLLFTHGLGVNGDLWRKVVPHLSGDFRCVVPDLPLGSHSSPMAPEADLSLPGFAKLVVEFMDAVELDAATLVGNDSGGAIAQMVAVDHPDRVTRLVLNACELYDRFLPPLFKPLQLVGSRVPGSVWLVAQLLRVRALQWALGYGPGLKKGLPDRATMDSYVRPLVESAGVRRDLRRFLRAVDARYTLDAAERLESFDKPVLLAWAADDLLFPLEHARLLAAALPDARLEVIPDARTFVPEDQPEALASLIRAFVREPVAVAA
jgi:pimeloyl-ACP methyl ester carboxylesterase